MIVYRNGVARRKLTTRSSFRFFHVVCFFLIYRGAA